MPSQTPADRATGALGFGAAAMLVCCVSHLLLVGVLGLALGTVLGVAAGIGAFIALGASLLIVGRRRRAACGVPVVTGSDTAGQSTTLASVTSSAPPSSVSARSGEPRPEKRPPVR